MGLSSQKVPEMQVACEDHSVTDEENKEHRREALMLAFCVIAGSVSAILLTGIWVTVEVKNYVSPPTRQSSRNEWCPGLVSAKWEIEQLDKNLVTAQTDLKSAKLEIKQLKWELKNAENKWAEVAEKFERIEKLLLRTNATSRYEE